MVASYALASDPSRRPSSVQAPARRSSRSSTPTKDRHGTAEASGSAAPISRTSRRGSSGSSIVTCSPQRETHVGPLFDDLIRPRQERGRDREAEGLGGLEVDDEFELGGLLDGEVGGLRAFEDF